MAGAKNYEAIIGPFDFPFSQPKHKLTVNERKARRRVNTLKAVSRSNHRKRRKHGRAV